MSIFRKKTLICIAVLLTLSTFISVSAEYRTVNVPLRNQQPYQRGCWAATGSSICGFKGINASKEHFAAKGGYNLANDVSRDIYVAESILNKYGIYGTFRFGFITYSEVKSNINSGKTMYVNVFQHAVALRGYRDEGTQQTQYTYFMDPWQGTYTFVQHNTLQNGNNSHNYLWSEALTNI